MKAYALVGEQHPPLRRALLEFPWPRIYEHPWMNCALAIERSFQGDDGVFVGLFRAPEKQSIAQLQEALRFYKNQPLERVGVYRRALAFSRVPRPIRRLFWWSTLNVSGFKRAKRFGTFGLTSYGALGAESLHPDLAADDHADVRADLGNRRRRGQADLRPPRPRRRLRRPSPPRHR